MSTVGSCCQATTGVDSRPRRLSAPCSELQSGDLVIVLQLPVVDL
jgi:hypothetical protein